MVWRGLSDLSVIYLHLVPAIPQLVILTLFFTKQAPSSYLLIRDLKTGY